MTLEHEWRKALDQARRNVKKLECQVTQADRELERLASSQAKLQASRHRSVELLADARRQVAKLKDMQR